MPSEIVFAQILEQLMDVLVSLAEALDVSLEYLVFGKEKTGTQPELSHLAAHLTTHIRSSQADGGALRDVIIRVGERLEEAIESTTRELISDVGNIGGILTLRDVARLERCS